MLCGTQGKETIPAERFCTAASTDLLAGVADRLGAVAAERTALLVALAREKRAADLLFVLDPWPGSGQPLVR